MSVADDIKAKIAELKARKEFVKRSGEEEIAKIEARIAELQRIQSLLTTQLDKDITKLKAESVI